MFYQSLESDPQLMMLFKRIKKEFKRSQSCVGCGVKHKDQNKMTVDHIKDVEDPSVDPFDMTNWQVLCIYCHRDKNREKMRSKHKIALERSDQKR